jgi:hypothetical protein
MRRGLVTLLAALVLGGAAWWFLLRPRPTDEERIYRLVANAAQAVERRNPSGVLRLVSESYHDSYGNSKRALAQQIIGGLRAAERYSVVPEVRSLQVSGDTARALGEPTGRGYIEAEVQLGLARERGRWLVTSADGWAPAVDSAMGE